MADQIEQPTQPKRLSLYEIYKDMLIDCSGLEPGPVVDQIMDSFHVWVEGLDREEHGLDTLTDDQVESLMGVAIEAVAWVCSGLTEHGLLQRDERSGDAS